MSDSNVSLLPEEGAPVDQSQVRIERVEVPVVVTETIIKEIEKPIIVIEKQVDPKTYEAIKTVIPSLHKIANYLGDLKSFNKEVSSDHASSQATTNRSVSLQLEHKSKLDALSAQLQLVLTQLEGVYNFITSPQPDTARTVELSPQAKQKLDQLPQSIKEYATQSLDPFIRELKANKSDLPAIVTAEHKKAFGEYTSRIDSLENTIQKLAKSVQTVPAPAIAFDSTPIEKSLKEGTIGLMEKLNGLIAKLHAIHTDEIAASDEIKLHISNLFATFDTGMEDITKTYEESHRDLTAYFHNYTSDVKKELGPMIEELHVRMTSIMEALKQWSGEIKGTAEVIAKNTITKTDITELFQSCLIVTMESHDAIIADMKDIGRAIVAEFEARTTALGVSEEKVTQVKDNLSTRPLVVTFYKDLPPADLAGVTAIVLKNESILKRKKGTYVSFNSLWHKIS